MGRKGKCGEHLLGDLLTERTVVTTLARVVKHSRENQQDGSQIGQGQSIKKKIKDKGA